MEILYFIGKLICLVLIYVAIDMYLFFSTQDDDDHANNYSE
jgi:hypothetical protein